MSKRIIKNERIKAIIHDIAQDFRFSQETGEYALLFYKVDAQGVVKGAEIDQMVTYLTTGLDELRDNMKWRREFLNDNPQIDEIRMLENLGVIEEEYIELLKFLA
ncbi:MAG TPA: hypothetical protein PLM93_04485 [Sulfuricurvum sp.]|nr:MAG: hypothetical protein B7Y30_05385 [Campylobacterales bacterium 16-40-21]OZA03248.1 MAG: hypothetical protein B7X89_04450 [Sulfuricurvum sp. 17-40-25]HQS66429.1 hypothetical protein [Sulfuricurvum sp.]HQT37089.1 hypothetical protein [Sulfuricurvum sp.]